MLVAEEVKNPALRAPRALGRCVRDKLTRGAGPLERSRRERRGESNRTMNVDKLAQMANQIAANFEHGPNQPRAVADVADHLLRFWTRQMRAELAESHACGTVTLTEVAALALTTATRPGAAPQVSGTGGDAG